MTKSGCITPSWLMSEIMSESIRRPGAVATRCVLCGKTIYVYGHSKRLGRRCARCKQWGKRYFQFF